MASVASAQQGDSISLPRVVITATRVASPVAGQTLATTVIQGDALRRAGVRDLAEALRAVPGVTIARTGGSGAQASLFLRGGESDFVRVLVDGVPVNDAGGAIDLSWLSLQSVERIEVVRGPSSVLYGTDAVTGVVQIFTRDGHGRARVEGMVEGARYRTTRAELSMLAGDDRAGLALTLGRDRSDGLLPFNNAYASDLLAIRSRARLGEATHLRFVARHADETYHYPTDGAGQVVDRNAWRADRRQTVSADMSHQWSPRWRAELAWSSHAGQGRTVDLPDDVSDTVGFVAYRSRGELRRRGASARLHLTASPASVLSLGAEWWHESHESRDSSNYDVAPNAFDADRVSRGLFAQWLAERGRLSLSAGARYDDHDTFGDFRTVRAAAAWRLWRGGALRLSAGNAFKAPTFFESFSTAFSTGNPSLVPERSRSWETGVRHDADDGRLSLAATWFDQRFSDLIQYTFRADGQPNYFNVARASAQGLEVEGAIAAGKVARLSAGATLLRTRVEDAGFDTGSGATFVRGAPLLRRPSRAGSIAFSTVAGGTTLDVAARFTGARDDRDFATFPATAVRLPAHTRVDLSLGRAVAVAGASAVRAHVRVENVLGARYQEVANFPAPGRTLAVGVRLAPR